MTDILEALSADVVKREAKAEQNRRDFPLMHSYLQALAIFNPRAIFAEENGRRVGKVPQ